MFCQFLDTIEVQKRKIDDLMAQAAEIESLKMQLSTENEKLENNESQIQVLKTDNQGIASFHNPRRHRLGRGVLQVSTLLYN